MSDNPQNRPTRTTRSSLRMALLMGGALGLLWYGMMPSPAVSQGAPSNSLFERVSELEGELLETQAALLELQETLAFVHLMDEEMNGLAGPHLIIEGCNLHVRNAAGATSLVDGTGNLIVGYNEDSEEDRSGSHNLVVGAFHTYPSASCFVAGRGNSVTGLAATVSGGDSNIASGDFSSVSGGFENEASGFHASVSGGRENEASRLYSSVSGGFNNFASGTNASVSGGRVNTASGLFSTVGGGVSLTASAESGYRDPDTP